MMLSSDVSAAYDLQYNALSLYTEAHRWTHWLSAATAINIKNYLRLQASVLGTFVQNGSKIVQNSSMLFNVVQCCSILFYRVLLYECYFT